MVLKLSKCQLDTIKKKTKKKTKKRLKKNLVQSIKIFLKKKKTKSENIVANEKQRLPEYRRTY